MLIAAASLASLLLGISSSALAVYPEKPIRIIVGFTPGGTADSIARLLASTMSTRLGQNMVVENRPGANGVLATEFVQRAAPDGYTIFSRPSAMRSIHRYTKMRNMIQSKTSLR
jgi:tripartite-type tricarboxylate transporter receptor subunit TctC